MREPRELEKALVLGGAERLTGIELDLLFDWRTEADRVNSTGFDDEIRALMAARGEDIAVDTIIDPFVETDPEIAMSPFEMPVDLSCVTPLVLGV